MSKSSSSSRNSTKYQQEKVTCNCQHCWERSEGWGLKVPRYMARKHAEHFPRHRTKGLNNLDRRYVAQPFGQSQAIHTGPHAAAASTAHGAVPNLEEAPEAMDTTQRPDDFNLPVFDKNLQLGGDATFSVVDDSNDEVTFLYGTSHSFSPLAM